MTKTVANPLSIEEIKDMRRTILAMEEEIHHPGAARYSKRDLLADIEDALYRLADVIERTERVEREGAQVWASFDPETSWKSSVR